MGGYVWRICRPSVRASLTLNTSSRTETREDRVTDWRSFQKGGKKKKAKTNVLG